MSSTTTDKKDKKVTYKVIATFLHSDCHNKNYNNENKWENNLAFTSAIGY